MMNDVYIERILKGSGYLFLILGICFGLLGIAEIYCFPLFSESGRFHYEGFGLGSFMFGNIVGQIIAYSLIAAIFIPLGLGHIRLKNWIIPLSKTLLWSWLVVGGPVILLIAFILLASKSLTIFLSAAALLLLALSYVAFPFLFLKFYNNPVVLQTVKKKDSHIYWISSKPIPLLVMAVLDLFSILILLILMLFNGIFLLFGKFLNGVPGILVLAVSILIFALLAWGTLKQKLWAWWSSVLWLGVLTLSIVTTFAGNTFPQLLSALAFPSAEVEFFENIPAQGYHFAILTGIPLCVMLLIAILAKPCFSTGDNKKVDI